MQKQRQRHWQTSPDPACADERRARRIPSVRTFTAGHSTGADALGTTKEPVVRCERGPSTCTARLRTSLKLSSALLADKLQVRPASYNI